jgi:hypothetical protein
MQLSHMQARWLAGALSASAQLACDYGRLFSEWVGYSTDSLVEVRETYGWYASDALGIALSELPLVHHSAPHEMR